MGHHAPEGSPVIGLHYFEPAADLRRHISSYYIFRADLPAVADIMRADIAQLRFMVAGIGAYYFSDGVRVPTPDICLLGPTTAATSIEVIGPLLVFGVGLHPAGWAALVREDASQYSARAEDAVGRFGSPVEEALDAMRCARSAAEMLAVANIAMRRLLVRAAEPPLWFTAMTDHWLIGEASPQVDTLVERTGMSARQVERLAKRIYGAPPKLLARKYRALRAASLLGTGKMPWTDVVGDAFYDQSHFIREFKHFTGHTPNQFQRAPSPLTQLTLQRRALIGKLPEIVVIT
jgi:methylphosphotriester-DNA--protein-cysteine methyltransferase